MKPQDYLIDAADVYDAKHKIYGDNYRVVGKVMSAMFPNGMTVLDEDGWNRLHLFILSVVKLTRYANNISQGGHEDSIKDLIVYQAMLQEIDEEVNEKYRAKMEAEENSNSAIF